MAESDMTLGLTLSETQLRELIVVAIFEKIDPAARERMMTAALTSLMEPRRGEYGKAIKSQLQEAVDQALLKCAREVCTEEFGKTEMREKVTLLIREAQDRLFSTEREDTVRRLAVAMSNALLNVER